MHKKLILTSIVVFTLVLSGCSEQKNHEHTFGDTWETNETDH